MIPNHILRCMAILATAYPKWTITEDVIAVWAEFLSDLPVDAVVSAVAQHVRTAKFPPSIAEIRKIAKGPAGLSGEEAWHEVIQQVRKHGWCGKPEFSDAKIRKGVQAIGGWRNLCSLNTTEMGVARAHFMRCYESFVARQEDAAERDAVAQLSYERDLTEPTRFIAPSRDDASTLEEFNERDLRDLEAEEEL